MEEARIKSLVLNAQKKEEKAIEEILKLFEHLLKTKICYNMDIKQLLKE